MAPSSSPTPSPRRRASANSTRKTPDAKRDAAQPARARGGQRSDRRSDARDTSESEIPAGTAQGKASEPYGARRNREHGGAPQHTGRRADTTLAASQDRGDGRSQTDRAYTGDRAGYQDSGVRSTTPEDYASDKTRRQAGSKSNP